MQATLCPLCQKRKAKRACPALGRNICAVCCGTKRLVEINCPQSCPYLSSAKAHPPAVVQKRQERDLGFLLPIWADLSDPQHQLLMFFQAVILEHAADALLPLRDEDVAEAAAVTAATLETSGRGIIYEHQATSVPAQRLVSDLKRALDEVTGSDKAPPPRLERDAAVVLRRIEQTARRAAQALPGEEPPVFLKLVGRVLQRIKNESSPDEESKAAGSRLIVPG